MKKTFLLAVIICCGLSYTHAQILRKIGDRVKNKTEQTSEQQAGKQVDKDTTGINNSNSDNTNTDATMSADNSNTVNTTPTLKVYANYDFVPGDTILFEDHFIDDQDGEFPSHWSLDKGQAILNKFNGDECFYLTDGNYCIVIPNTNTKSYLGNIFTIEYDTYNPDNAAYGLMCFFKNAQGEDLGYVQATAEGVQCNYADGKSLFGSHPKELQYDNYKNKWHHVAIAYKNGQIKVYVDQFRVLVVPNANIQPGYIDFGGIGDGTNPIIFKNIRVAEGGSQNMLGKKFTDNKIITHGINFDIDKSTIRPESMGTLNMVIQVLKDNPDIKFEVDGHTDNSGSAAHNLALSQQRADAVRNQLISMGIDGARLTSKGWGDTKPISDNGTLEGRANNRRVEFVKM
jgi:OmpA-OmpF porin, OOP family